MRSWLRAASLLVCLAGWTASVSAQDKEPGQDQPPQMTEEEKKMMEAWAKAMTPGEQHKLLEALVGDWNVASKHRMAPEAPWTESKGEEHTESVLGGRFTLSRYSGEAMMGMPGNFEGIGINGYDNVLGKYTFAWVDNMGTMILTGEGEADKDGKTLTFMSRFKDCMTGENTWMKMVHKFESKDKHVVAFFGPAPDGKEFQMMELTYTRKPKS